MITGSYGPNDHKKMSYPIPKEEDRRLAALESYRIMDSGAEQAFDDFVELASRICGTPIALITLLDSERQWFKARKGLEVEQTPREHAFCSHTIMTTETMVVNDAQQDQRFRANPLVTGDPYIRFYAGAPLIDRDGQVLGSLCVIDREPQDLSEENRKALEALGRQIIAQMDLRKTSAELAECLASIRTLHGLLPICCYCKGVRDDAGYWQRVEDYVSEHTDADFSHGICPDCLETHHPEVSKKMRPDEASAR
jgi:hypothetical protein